MDGPQVEGAAQAHRPRRSSIGRLYQFEAGYLTCNGSKHVIDVDVLATKCGPGLNALREASLALFGGRRQIICLKPSGHVLISSDSDVVEVVNTVRFAGDAVVFIACDEVDAYTISLAKSAQLELLPPRCIEVRLKLPAGLSVRRFVGPATTAADLIAPLANGLGLPLESCELSCAGETLEHGLLLLDDLGVQDMDALDLTVGQARPELRPCTASCCINDGGFPATYDIYVRMLITEFQSSASSSLGSAQEAAAPVHTPSALEALAAHYGKDTGKQAKGRRFSACSVLSSSASSATRRNSTGSVPIHHPTNWQHASGPQTGHGQTHGRTLVDTPSVLGVHQTARDSGNPAVLVGGRVVGNGSVTFSGHGHVGMQTIQISVMPTMSVRDLRVELEGFTGVPVAAQRLLCDGHTMQAHHRLSHYRIGPGSIVNQLLKTGYPVAAVGAGGASCSTTQ